MHEARKAFEEWTKRHSASWSLGTVVSNGEFHHYMDPDTDTAWLGFWAGWSLSTKRASDLCDSHIEVVASRGLRWLEPHDRINEELHSGLSYAKAIRGEEGSIRDPR